MLKQIIYIFWTLVCLINMSCEQAQKQESTQGRTNKTQQTEAKTADGAGNNQADDKIPPSEARRQIPTKVYKVLDYIRENGEAMPNYVGGRVFQNRERRLAIKDSSGKKIKYQEWDVNPKRSGVNRGVERLVTGSDNRAWYTNDHYLTFVEVQ